MSPRRYAFSLAVLILFFAIPSHAQALQRQVDSLALIACDHPSDSTRIWALTELTYLYAQLSLDSAVVYGERATCLADAEGSLVQRGSAHNDYASALMRSGQLVHAGKEYRLAERFRLEAGDTTAAMGTLTNLGTMYYQMANYDSAMALFVPALAHFEQHGLGPRADLVRENIAGVYKGIGEYTKSMAYLRENLVYRRSKGDSMGVAQAYLKIGAIEVAERKLEAALVTYTKAVAITQESGPASPQHVSTLYNIGVTELELNRPDVALQRFAETRLVAEKIGDNIRLALVEQGEGEAYRRKGAFAQAVAKFQRARPMLEAVGETDQALTSLFGLAVAFAGTGRADSSSFYVRAHQEKQLVLAEQRSVEAIAELETKYQTAEKERQLAEARAARAEDQLAGRRRTMWLLGGIALMAMLGAIGYLRARQQRIINLQQAQEAQLQLALTKIEAQNELQEQRLRISRDLHDNIGAQLSFIISSVDALKPTTLPAVSSLGDRLGHLSDFASGTVRDLRDTVWAMNRERISVEDLQARIGNFIERARQGESKTAFVLDVSAAALALPALPTLAGMNVYRILQESIHNAFKYADAQQIRVSLDAQDQQLMVSVVDDGKGFDSRDERAAVLRGGGNGLTSMRKRAEEVGGQLQVESRPGAGTQMTLRLPLDIVIRLAPKLESEAFS